VSAHKRCNATNAINRSYSKLAQDLVEVIKNYESAFFKSIRTERDLHTAFSILPMLCSSANAQRNVICYIPHTRLPNLAIPIFPTTYPREQFRLFKLHCTNSYMVALLAQWTICVSFGYSIPEGFESPCSVSIRRVSCILARTCIRVLRWTFDQTENEISVIERPDRCTIKAFRQADMASLAALRPIHVFVSASLASLLTT